MPSASALVVWHVDFHAAHGFAASSIAGNKCNYIDSAVAVSKPLSSEVRRVGSDSIRVRSVVNTVVVMAIALVMPMEPIMFAEPVG